MSSDDEKIVHSVEAVISAAQVLAQDISQSPRLDGEQKTAVLTKIGAVAEQLKDIHTTLFQVSDHEGTSTVIGNDAELASAMAALAPALDEALSEEEVTQPATEADVEAPRLVVTPVVPQAKPDEQQVAEDEDVVASSDEDAQVGNNLQLIDGIDQEVETVLNEAGVFHFSDIAAFHEADVVKISTLLDDPFRVARQNWVEQANLLAQDVSTVYAQRLVGAVFFDRRSLLTAFEASTAAPIGEEGETDASQLAVAGVGVALKDGASFSETLLREKEALEIELAALRAELAETGEDEFEREPAGSEVDVPEEMPAIRVEEGQEEDVDPALNFSRVFEEGEGLETLQFSPRLQAKISGTNPEEGAFDVDAGDGAIWHEEVSVAPDYQPPSVDDYPVEEDGPVGADDDLNGSDALEDQPDFGEGDEISVPFARQSQDEFINRVFERDVAGEDAGEVPLPQNGEGGPEGLPHFSEAALGAFPVPPSLPEAEVFSAVGSEALSQDLPYQGEISQADRPPLPPLPHDAPAPMGRPPFPPPQPGEGRAERQQMRPPPVPLVAKGVPVRMSGRQEQSLPPPLPPVAPGSPPPRLPPLPGHGRPVNGSPLRPPAEALQAPVQNRKQVSDDFKDKARKFTESLEKSFSRKED